MQSQVNQNTNDAEEQDLREEDGAPHDLEMVVLDFQQDQVALVMPDSESHMSSLITKTQDKPENLEDQAALIAREMENAEEHFEDDQISPPVSDNPNTCRGIDEDTFSIMMTSKVRSLGWKLGLGTFAFQMTLIISILLMRFQQQSEGTTPFDTPIRVNNEVRHGQVWAVILSLHFRKKILTAIDYLIAFRSSLPVNKDSGFYRLLVDDDDADHELHRRQRNDFNTWFLRAIVPNCLKLIQGISVLFVALIVIIQSDKLVGLLRDFTALYILSEIDNIVFKIASKGYFGENLKARTENVKHVKVDLMEDVTTTTSCGVKRFKRQLKMFVLFALQLTMFSFYLSIAIGQTSGAFLRMKYPNCEAVNPYRIGDGICDNSDPYNSEACGFDDGDCLELNARTYPDCTAPYENSRIGDGRCDNEDPYNTEPCGYDGGDCLKFNEKYPDCTAPYPSLIDDGVCYNKDPYNTKACGYDGGDCLDFNARYPDCTAPYPYRSGDGMCDNEDPYNTEACGYDGGDCLEFNYKYPNCKVLNVYSIGDGVCDNLDPLNTEACGFDGGDCLKFNARYPNCKTLYPYRIGDGICHNEYPYNTKACGYDGGDCLDFNYKYPDCKAVNVYRIGDGKCDDEFSPPYNTIACGYDGGDCLY